MSSDIRTRFLGNCREKFGSLRVPFPAELVRGELGGTGSAEFTFKAGGLLVQLVLDRGMVDCLFSAVEGSTGSVFLSQIADRYAPNFRSGDKYDVNHVFSFIESNLQLLVDDFTEIKNGRVPPRLVGVDFTPPLHILSEIALRNAGKKRRSP